MDKMNKDNFLFKTNYGKFGLNTEAFSDALQKFEVHNKALSYFPRRAGGWSGRDRDIHVQSEYDLYEVGRIIDTESLVNNAYTKRLISVFKEGWEIVSNNPSNEKYIKRRLTEIQYVSEIRWQKFLKEIALNLINFHNCFILKVRKADASSGKTRKRKGTGRELQPVAGYFILPPETIEVKTNKYGDIIKYRQYVQGGRKIVNFEPYNIIHLHFSKRTGNYFGTPLTEATKDDILALRKIEESVETLIYKTLFPIIHVKVGTEKAPAKTLPNGISEVAVAKRLLQTLDDSGGIATSERVEVNMVGAESLALRVGEYLTHFKQRVYSGMGMSSLEFGDLTGGGQAAAEFLHAQHKDWVWAYQDEIQEMITYEIFDELLLESGKYKHSFEIDDDDRVFFAFHEPNVDHRIKKENHTLNKIDHDLLSTDESRRELKYSPLGSDGERNVHNVKINRMNADEQLKRDEHLARVQAAVKPKPAGSSGSSGGSKTTKSGTKKSQPTKKAGGQKKTQSQAKPRNQNTKDWLIKTMYKGFNNKNIKDEINNILVSAIHDYILYQSTEGAVTSEDGIVAPDVLDQSSNIIKGLLASLNSVEKEFDQYPILLNKKKDMIIRQSIDKADNYINNITN